MDPEYDRVNIGRHIGRVRRFPSLEEEGEILRGAVLAGLLGFLERHPLGEVSFVPQLGFRDVDTLNRYTAGPQLIELDTTRPPYSFGQPFEPSTILSVSFAGPTIIAAMQRSFVHELGHHLHSRLGNTLVKERSDPALNLGLNAGSVISRNAGVSWKEYFCENLVAYVFHPTVLKGFDPLGYALVEGVLAMPEVRP